MRPGTGINDYELFEPSSRENKFEIWTSKPDEEYDKKTRAIGRVLNIGHAAALCTYFQGLNYNFCIDRSAERARHAPVIFIDRHVDQVYGRSDLAQTLRGNVTHDDNKVEFGVALQGSRRGSPDTILGFEFASFQLREYGGMTGGGRSHM